MRVEAVLFAAMCGVAVAAPAQAAHAPHKAAQAPHRAAQAPAINADVLIAEILLDRVGASPGAIDGRDGDNFANALHVFQQANGLPVGMLDQETAARLTQSSSAPVLAQYTIRPDDVKGPFAPRIPQDFRKMARLPRLSYNGPRQLLAERFHMAESLLAALNPKASFDQPGTTITVANVPPMPENPKLAAAEAKRNSGSSTEEGDTAAKVVVDKQHRGVLVYSSDNRPLAFYPASIGSTEKPAPSGTLTVRSVAYDPTYTYDPAYAFKGQKAERKVTVKPGPNNPVGVVWIGLSANGYGIHGTPDPDQVGKTQSHGCIRLTNWDALALARIVKRGTPVDFVG